MKIQDTFHVGCPRLDIVSETINKDLDIDEINSLEDLGVGNRLDYEEDFAPISLHPVTTNDQSPDINMIIDLCLKKLCYLFMAKCGLWNR